MIKSSRHSKITGDFAEALVLYWLSKNGFECARVDHTGIDLLARNPSTNELMGISVKSRSRYPGTEHESVNLPSDDLKKAKTACAAFGCTPYFAIVVDSSDIIRAFIVPMARLIELANVDTKIGSWRMSASHLAMYAKDSDIKSFELRGSTLRWW